MRAFLRSTLAFLVLSFIAPTAGAYTEPILQSYTRESPDRAFVFVMLHAPRAEPDPIRAKYPASGLYRNDGTLTPLWTFDDGYVREAYPASDGVHVVVQYLHVISLNSRTCGNSPPEPPADPEVFGVYSNGKKFRHVKLGELLDRVAFCREHEPGWHPWLESARINDDDGTLVVRTTRGTRCALDLKTGNRIEPQGIMNEVHFDHPNPAWSEALLILGVVLALMTVAGTVAVVCLLWLSRK
jgi:hypothetical protein